MEDNKNPAFLFQTTGMHLLLQIALGNVDAKKLAQQEIAARGFGKGGEWIGFDAAKKTWGVK